MTSVITKPRHHIINKHDITSSEGRLGKIVKSLKDGELFPYEETFANGIRTMGPTETETVIEKAIRIIDKKQATFEILEQTLKFLSHLPLDA